MQTLIRLLLKEKSDFSLHCLQYPLCQKLWCTKFPDIYHIVYAKEVRKKSLKIADGCKRMSFRNIQYSMFTCPVFNRRLEGEYLMIILG